MRTITLNIKKTNDYQLLLLLAKRLGINHIDIKEEDKAIAGNPELEMSKALDVLAARGGIKSLPDPVEWQRTTRKDRRLPGRK